MSPRSKYLGAAIALGASLAAAVGLVTGHIQQHVATGIAVIGILFGSALARGRRRTKPTAQSKG